MDVHDKLLLCCSAVVRIALTRTKPGQHSFVNDWTAKVRAGRFANTKS